MAFIQEFTNDYANQGCAKIAARKWQLDLVKMCFKIFSRNWSKNYNILHEIFDLPTWQLLDGAKFNPGSMIVSLAKLGMTLRRCVADDTSLRGRSESFGH